MNYTKVSETEITRQLARYQAMATEYVLQGKPIPEEIYRKIMNYSLAQQLVDAHGEQLNGLGSPYIPSSEAPRLNVEVPDKMNDETHEILAKIDAAVGGIDEYVRKKLKYKSLADMYSTEKGDGLSAEQIDAIGMAIYNIETENQMMIVSDQTGVGKGRIAAAIIKYALNIGKKPIFITIRPNLFTDIYRDLQDIHCEDLVPVKQLQKYEDEYGFTQVKMRTTRRMNKETGVITETQTPVYKKIEHPKFGKQIKPFILNNKGDEDPSIKTQNGDIAYEVLSDEERKSEYKRVVIDHDYRGYDCFLMTYSQFADANIELKKNLTKLNFLRDIAMDNIIILDESHMAGGVDSNTGNCIRDVLNNFKPMGGLFLSATFAKDPKNMPLYAATTSMKYAGLQPKQYVDAMQMGGNALQEIISAQLAQSGCFIRRERPLSNVVFNYITLDGKGKAEYGVPDKEIEHCAIFDNITTILKNIIRFQTDFVNPLLAEKQAASNEGGDKSKNGETLNYKSDPIFSRLFQIVNQAVFSLKAEEVANRAIQRMKQGMKPVITFENTMDSWVDRLVEMYGAGNPIYTDFSVVLKAGIEKTLHYTEIKTIVIPPEVPGGKEGKMEIKVAKILDPESELSRAGVEFYFDLLDRINESTLGISVAPIDIITTKIKAAGFSIGEITGRKNQVEFTDDKMNRGIVRKRQKENTNSVVLNFQTNKIDCILLNAAGSTAISLHAQLTRPEVTVTYKNPPTSLANRKEVKKRVMIVCQPNLDINSMVQTWGRINRSGQVYRPEYDFVTLAVPAETRLMMFLQRKLRSLDSNTTSNQKQNESVLNLEDFMNKYGDGVVETWLSENKDLDLEMHEPLWKKVSWHKNSSSYPTRGEPRVDEEYYDSENAAQIVSGRVALLKTDDQRKFYNEVNEKYKAQIQKLKNEGTNTLEVEFLPLNAIVKSTKEIFTGDNTSNPFAAATIMEELEVDVLAKPYTVDELNNVINSNLDDATPEQVSNELIRKSGEYYTARAIDYEKTISAKFDKDISDIPTKLKIKKILADEGKEAYQKAIQNMVTDLQVKKREAINLRIADVNSSKETIQQYFKSLIIGKGYLLQTGEYATGSDNLQREIAIKSVLSDIIIDETKSNPWTPSNITFRFATSAGNKFRDYSPTESGGKTTLDRTISITRNFPASTDYWANWEILTKNEDSDREIRYMITGNILRAYMGQQVGKLVTFTYADGSEKKGMLMHKNFVQDMFTTVPLLYCKRLIENLQTGDTLSNNTKTGNSEVFDGITFSQESWRHTEIKIIVGNNAKNAAKYYKNESVRKLLIDTYSGFQSERGNMVAYMKMENLQACLEILDKELQPREQIKLTAAQLEIIKPYMPNNNNSSNEKPLSKIIKFEAKYLNHQTMKSVAGIGKIKEQKTSKADEQIRANLDAYLKRKGLAGAHTLTDAEMKKTAKKYNINLDNLNL